MTRNKFIFSLLLLMAAATTWAAPTGSAPKAGGTYYLYNVGEGKYLSTSAGNAVLSASGTAVTITSKDATAGTYTLTMAGDTLSYTFLTGRVNGNGRGNYNEWTLELADSDNGYYQLACRAKEASSNWYLYWNDAISRLACTPYQLAISQGEWLFVSSENYEDPTLDLKETEKTYQQPEAGSYTVHLYRTLVKNSWNTFCVPFAIDEAQLKAAFGSEVQLGEYTGVNETTLLFTRVYSIEAGKPYILYPTIDRSGDYYTFSNVKAFVSEPTVVEQKNDKFTVTFKSSFIDGNNIPEGSYVLNSNKIYHLTSPATMKAFRGYFEETANSSGAKITSWAFDNGATAITKVDGKLVGEFDIYNLSGQLVRHHATSTQHLAKGVYIVNGKKVIVK